jgi:hypothetical protein
MNRNLKVRRIYNLGDYNNIEFTEEITDIPEKFVLNEEVMSKFRQLLMLNIDSGYIKYTELLKLTDEERLELRNQTLEFIKKEN